MDLAVPVPLMIMFPFMLRKVANALAEFTRQFWFREHAIPNGLPGICKKSLPGIVPDLFDVPLCSELKPTCNLNVLCLFDPMLLCCAFHGFFSVILTDINNFHRF
jgi:hypothetical protein